MFSITVAARLFIMIFLSAACRAAGRDVPVADRPLPHERQVLQFALYAGKRFPAYKNPENAFSGSVSSFSGTSSFRSFRNGSEKASASFFFHPDCTVGSGFQPDQPPMAGRGLIRKGICRHGITAGRELHPTLKNVTFYVVADAASAAVFCSFFIIAENGRLSIVPRAFFRRRVTIQPSAEL